MLTVAGLSKSFGGRELFDDVSLNIMSGDRIAITGPNGAGKSTLIKIITGAHQPDAGEIVVAGETVAGLTPARAQQLGIACIYQQPALFADLTVAENIGIRLEPASAGPTAGKPAAEPAPEAVSETPAVEEPKPEAQA